MQEEIKTFICDDCGKTLPVNEKCFDVDVCRDCIEYYPNETGHCSAYCRLTGNCDESC